MISCQVEGLLSVLDSVAWKKSNDDAITGAMADFEIEDGTYDTGTKSQTTTLTVKNGINTADTTYKCAVTRGGQTRETVVSLKIFSKYLPVAGVTSQLSKLLPNDQRLCHLTINLRRLCVRPCVQKSLERMRGGLSKACLELRRRYGPSRFIIPFWATGEICLPVYFITVYIYLFR